MIKKSKPKVVAESVSCDFFGDASWHRWFGFVLIALCIPVFFTRGYINALALLIPSILLIIVGKKEQHYAMIKTIASVALFILALFMPFLNILVLNKVSYDPFLIQGADLYVINDAVAMSCGLLITVILLAVVIKQRK